MTILSARDKSSKGQWFNTVLKKLYKNKRASTPQRRNACLRHYTLWPWPLTYDLENLFCNCHSYDEYLRQVSLKSMHEVQRYRVTRNRLKTDEQRTDGRTAGRHSRKHNAFTVCYCWRHKNTQHTVRIYRQLCSQVKMYRYGNWSATLWLISLRLTIVSTAITDIFVVQTNDTSRSINYSAIQRALCS